MIPKKRHILLAVLLAALCGCAHKKPAPKMYAFWPPAPDEPRIQYLCSFQSSASVEPGKGKLDELIYGKEIQQVQSIAKPYGIDMWNGKIYVCDLRSSAVIILDLRKQQTLIIGRGGADSFQTPTDITIAPDGTKYIADLGKGSIVVYDANDKHLTNYTLPDLKPVGVAVFENELYVCDFNKQCVQVLDRRTGSFLRKIGGPGQGDGQFIRPLGIATDAQGFLYVTDVLNCRMQKFDRQGKFVTGFGIISANAGGFVRPKHIAVDQEGTIYVVDAAFQNVQLFDQIGRVYTYFGTAGDHPGAMYLPAGIAVHEGDLDLFQKFLHPAFEMQRVILVTNQFGDNKVACYALGHLKAGKTVKDIEASEAKVPTGVADRKQTGPGAALPSTLPSSADEFRGGTEPATRPNLTEEPARK